MTRLPSARRVWGPDCVRLDMEEHAAEYLIELLSTEYRVRGDVGALELRSALIDAMSEDAS